MDALVPILMCLGTCVVLPVMMLVTRARQNETNRKTEIMLKAIETGATNECLLNRLIWGCATTILGVALAVLGIVMWVNWNGMTLKVSFVMPLIFAGIFLAIGVSLFIGFFVVRKMLSKEIEAEKRQWSRNYHK